MAIETERLDRVLERKHGVHDLTKNGKCTGCGGCCGNYLPMTEKEIRTIRRYIKKNNIKPHQLVVGPLAAPTIDLTCPFLDSSKSHDKCMIYAVRPAICRCFMCSDPVGTLDNKELLSGVRATIDVRKTFFK